MIEKIIAKKLNISTQELETMQKNLIPDVSNIYELATAIKHALENGHGVDALSMSADLINIAKKYKDMANSFAAKKIN